MPARIIPRIVSGDSDAGTIVARIFVRRAIDTRSRVRSPVTLSRTGPKREASGRASVRDDRLNTCDRQLRTPTVATTVRKRIQAMTEDASVSPLELFFDLVFVYALTQVTALLSDNLTGRGVLQGMIVLALVWWSWVGYSWLGNSVRADEGWTRGAFIAVMAAVFIAAIAIPEAFDDRPGGLSGPLTVAACYAVVRLVHLGLYAYFARQARDPGLMRQLARFAVVTVGSVSLMIAGGIVEGDAQLVLWLLAVAIDYVGTQAIGASGWRLYAPGHFSERHGLIIIIALGESIVAIGVGAAALPVSTPLILAAILGILLVAAMWWVYFDVTALAAERRLAGAEWAERARLARDSYTYLHLPMVAGIVFAALGLKKVLGYVAGDDGHDWNDSLSGLPVWSLHGGPALYLLSLILFRLRNVRSISKSRTPALVLLLATAPLGERIGALPDLLLVTGIMAGLIAWEAIRYAESRHRIRHEGDHRPMPRADAAA
jgi:low temperature requirement protein LtrA